ncbi:uncharacterized protein LOC119689743 [Teleopsis dalmanni]|uniref:uncharacterized protein LOC119689743 n=1 Tax=Teleopsis dalmanni TaxID=139649 RepID=UPI0018CFA5B7|nr:uncharacterized protein LOC119689743 [Teleopsis dalmanni]
MAMYYYASKISAIACGTRCRQTVLQKSRGQRDRDKYNEQSTFDECYTTDTGDADVTDIDISTNKTLETVSSGVRLRRRFSEQLDAYDIELGFQTPEVSTIRSTRSNFIGYGIGSSNMDSDIVQYDVPKNTHKRIQPDVNYESSVLGSGGIMYINGRIVSGPLDSLVEVLVPKKLIDFDKEFIFSFLLSSRLFLRPHELLGKLLSLVPDSDESLESLVALLAEWTNKFPYDYRDERMMNHVKHIVARCSNTQLEAVVSEILSALLKRLTDLEKHEEELRACQTNTEKSEANYLDCATSSQYAQILCRLEKKLAKHIGPEEFLQCSSNVLLDKQKKWDQPTTSGGPPGVQDPKKTCNLETYLDWSARLRLFVCNEILQCSGIRDRSKTVELWSGVAQYCLLVGNYNSATAILETLESPPIARLKITWSKLQVTCQQLDCMQRHAEGHGDLWHKQAIVLNENHQKTDTTVVILSSSSSTTPATKVTTSATITSTATPLQPTTIITTATIVRGADVEANTPVTVTTAAISAAKTDINETNEPIITTTATTATATTTTTTTSTATTSTTAATMAATTLNKSTESTACIIGSNINSASNKVKKISTATAGVAGVAGAAGATTTVPSTSTSTTTPTPTKPNDWVVIPVFADIVKLALAGREDCLQRLPNGHINIVAFERMAAIVGAFTKHMNGVKSATEAPPGEYEMFCRHMQKTSKLNESELMMASFDCEEPNNAEKLMYDLN